LHDGHLNIPEFVLGDESRGGNMLDQLVNETASRFNLSTSSVSALLRGLLSLITNEQTGGAEGFVDRFRLAGFSFVMTSWYGGTDTRTISATNLESVLGTTALDTLAASAGLTRTAANTVITFLLPRLGGRLTPNGVLPSSTAIRWQVSSYIEQPAVSAVERAEDRRDWPAWLGWTAVALMAFGVWLWLRPPVAKSSGLWVTPVAAPMAITFCGSITA
jgi:uncharacterized protein YidB (DUF937 family)